MTVTDRTVAMVMALLVAFSALQPALGQAAAEDGPTGEAPAAGEAPATGEEEPTLALAAVGLSAGFPSYQTVAPTVSLQSGHFGVQAKASWTPAGPYLGLQLRGYPPVPIPVPVFVGVGGGFYGRDFSYHAALGAHVPLGLNARLDLEGGVANVPLLDGRVWAPHLAVGVSYAFPVEIAPGGGPDGLRGGAFVTTPRCAEPTEPDEGALGEAVARTVEEWLDSARATYGSVYTDLSYRYRVVSTRVDGDEATVVVEYAGSVTEIATGQRHSASGEAKATFVWTGCGWRNTDVDY